MLKQIARCAILLVVGMNAMAQDGSSPADVVRAFNEAVTVQDLDAMLALLAEGGVRYNLRPAHRGMVDDGLTQDLKVHWQTVAPLLFNVTESYTRQAEVQQVHQDGELATVWAFINTRTVPLDNGGPSQESFVELYMLVRVADGSWKIAGVADNREPDDIDVGG